MTRAKVSLGVQEKKGQFTLVGIQFLKVTIPEATRKDRPIYLKQTPIKNSYRRLNESDQKMSDEEVKRALAEQMNDSVIMKF